jgi:hypothetical protein
MMKRFFCASLLVSCAVAAGCSSSNDNGSSAPSGSDAGSNDGSTSSDISIAATSAPFTVSEDTTFTGNGANDVGAIAITDGVGTIQFKNESANAFFFNATGVPTGTVDGGDLDGGEFAADRDFEIIAAQESRLIVAFITCTGPKLTFIFYESTDGIASGKELPATGSCAILEKSTTENVTFPALDFPPPSVVSGFSITGSQMAFDGTHVGSTTISGTSYALYPFNVVDCTACASPGWYELHSLLWDEKNKNACLGILYLEQNTPSTVGLAYMMCLPAVTSSYTTAQLGFSADWTAP